ncbi:hypothetical protein IJU97_06715 [bacterium]|nr:hypothetical protein [bacterium]
MTSNGRSIALLSQSSVSASTLFEEAYSANSFFTWLIRGLGLLLLFAAFSMIFEIITTLAKVVPFIANIVG